MAVAMTAAMTAEMAAEMAVTAVLLKHYYDVLIGLLIGYRRCKM
jgi:hypothetical protein